MGIFDFDRAIVRKPALSVVNGLRSAPDVTAHYDAILREHKIYVTELRAAGLLVDVLPPLEAYPDSVFVEDPALVFSEGAILLCPCALSRRGETADMRRVLARNFAVVQELTGNEYADGGDVLVTPNLVLIGLSARTKREGAAALANKIETFGRRSRVVEVPRSVLHLKSAVSLLDEETVLITPELASSDIFTDFRKVVVPTNEEAAANALRIRDRILIGDSYPRTLERVVSAGFRTAALPTSEIAKLDAGLSCMSLRWRAFSSC